MQRLEGVRKFEYKFLDYILTRDNQLIKSTTFIRTGAKELAVLRALLESAGKLMTKDELLDQVWGTTFVSEESLARCVYILRKILKKNNHQALIQTVYSKGYIFVAEVTKHLPPENVESEVEIIKPLLTSVSNSTSASTSRSTPSFNSTQVPTPNPPSPTPPPQPSNFQEMLEALLGNKFSLLEVLGQKHIAIEIKISLPAPTLAAPALPAPESAGKNVEN
ncbi:winged helix-turn-helix domain-containing protein [Rouxiella sp. T17]|uniref:winged helix-turn-helix domain-containing protein n=1 Tax=Rouxiella sp. T17 TaxID=3085684 RepID=UPI002FCA289B